MIFAAVNPILAGKTRKVTKAKGVANGMFNKDDVIVAYGSNKDTNNFVEDG